MPYVEPTLTVTFDVATRQDDASTSVYCAGTWNRQTVSGAYGGSYDTADQAGAIAYFSTTGTEFDLTGPTGPNLGIGRVVVDGTTAGYVDQYSASSAQGVRLFRDMGLSAGTHRG